MSIICALRKKSELNYEEPNLVKAAHLIWFQRYDYSLCGCYQPTLGLWIEKSPPEQINSCIFYCVFKAFVVEVASHDVSKSERVRDTHGVCTTSDWLLFSKAWHMQCRIFLIAMQTQTLIHIRMVIQQLSRLNKSPFFQLHSIPLIMHTYTRRPDILLDVTHTLQPWHLTPFSMIIRCEIF